MRILKPTSNYLRNRANKNLVFAILSLAAFIVLYLSVLPNTPFFVDLGKYEGARAAVYALPPIAAVYFYRRYRRYKQGYQGEIILTKLLKSANLPEDYLLINDFYPPNGYGNIDHILLSPRGIFAIETKNQKGKMTSYGDYWSIRTRGKKGQNQELGSPSAQAKMNAVALKRAIESIDDFKQTRIWVEPVVFLANLEAEYVDLAPNESTVAVKKVHELPQYLTEFEGRSDSFKTHFSRQEIDLIGKELLQQAKN